MHGPGVYEEFRDYGHTICTDGSSVVALSIAMFSIAYVCGNRLLLSRLISICIKAFHARLMAVVIATFVYAFALILYYLLRYRAARPRDHGTSPSPHLHTFSGHKDL